MDFPFQCLVARSRTADGLGAWTLFGASGPKLVVQSSDGTISVWPQQLGRSMNTQEDETQEPPGKRIKLSPPVQPQEQKFNFSSLVLSKDGNYLVGVTGEDKCIRVFQIDAQSRLTPLSERCMSRRPSSITLTSDDSTILCADKFGDVYALPLLISPDDEQSEASLPAKSEAEEKGFTPSASVLTVHSGRNRRTLEEQLKQKAKGPAKTKEAMTFRHDLLLGHVSMLTDLAFAKVNNRSYIITADRDEHIRISRGPTQAHIIEGFCFGHEEFVSKLCVTRSGLLVSGGGDSHLFVWDWQQYRLVEKLPLRHTVIQYLKTCTEVDISLDDDASLKLAVTGIWEVPSSNDKDSEILVACEGIPALFSFGIDLHTTTGISLPLSGNPLDVAFVTTSPSSWAAIVSVDNVHKPASTTEFREDKGPLRLQYYTKQGDGQWCEAEKMKQALQLFAEEGSKMDVASNNNPGQGLAENKTARDILYHVENLRKRPGADD